MAKLALQQPLLQLNSFFWWVFAMCSASDRRWLKPLSQVSHLYRKTVWCAAILWRCSPTLERYFIPHWSHSSGLVCTSLMCVVSSLSLKHLRLHSEHFWIWARCPFRWSSYLDLTAVEKSHSSQVNRVGDSDPVSTVLCFSVPSLSDTGGVQVCRRLSVFPAGRGHCDWSWTGGVQAGTNGLACLGSLGASGHVGKMAPS